MGHQIPARLAGAALASALSAFLAATPGHAALIADGITYTLTDNGGTTTTHSFTLSITGINGPSDTEGGRSGVNALAFVQPSGFVSATAPTGFVTVVGGLNSTGCDSTGNFFCFDNTSIPPTPGTALPTNSSLSYNFSVTISSTGSFSGFTSGFKIDWVGTQNNYDLVSQQLLSTPGTNPPPVPEPASLALFGMGLLGLGAMRRLLIGA